MNIFLSTLLIVLAGVSADSNFVRRVQKCKSLGGKGCQSRGNARCCDDNICVSNQCVAPPSPTTPPPTPEPTSSQEPSASPVKAPTPEPTSSQEPSESPSESPSQNPGPSATPLGVSYTPGKFPDPPITATDGKLWLSEGLSARPLTCGGQPVVFDLPAGGTSEESFHRKADGAAVIPKPGNDGWYYVSNSEVGSSGGGVGAIEFDSAGRVIGYKRLLSGTNRNCGGGRSPWGTWLSAEEDQRGRVWEVDPHTGDTQETELVDSDGWYESVAYHIYTNGSGAKRVRFFTTEDDSDGTLVRFTPCESSYSQCNSSINDGLCSSLISKNSCGTHDFLVLNNDGTYEWATKRTTGEGSARKQYRDTEGIDCWSDKLFFASKSQQELFELDLLAGTWSKSSTLSGLFNLDPDQLGRFMGDESERGDVLYFCEDGGGASDVHGRDATGKYFTIVQGKSLNTETTGLAFSPDNMFMYVSFQGPSIIYEIKREDELPFSGAVADTHYHGEHVVRV